MVLLPGLAQRTDHFEHRLVPRHALRGRERLQEFQQVEIDLFLGGLHGVQGYSSTNSRSFPKVSLRISSPAMAPAATKPPMTATALSSP